MSNGPWQYVRYSDDMTLVAKSQSDLQVAIVRLRSCLKDVHLNLNESKSFDTDAHAGLDFLGFHINLTGIKPGGKAVTHLEQILSTTLARDEIEQAEQEWRGWCNYFGMPVFLPTDPASYLFALQHCSKGEEALTLLNGREKIQSPCEDWLIKVGQEWLRLGYQEEAFFEFCRATDEFPPGDAGYEALRAIFGERASVVIATLSSAHKGCADKELWATLAEVYTDNGLFALAKKALERAGINLDETTCSAYCAGKSTAENSILTDRETVSTREASAIKMPNTSISPVDSSVSPVDSSISSVNPSMEFLVEDLELAVSLFSGGEGISAIEQVDDRGKRTFVTRDEPLTPFDWQRHLAGDITLGLYLMRSNNTVKLAVIDVDISKAALLEFERNEEQKEVLRQEALNDAKLIIQVCNDRNIPVILEDSGRRGYHLWFFFEEPERAEKARRFLIWLLRQVGNAPRSIYREIFPKENYLGIGRLGSVIKLPLGIHSESGHRSLFLTASGEVSADQAESLRQIQKIPHILINENKHLIPVKQQEISILDNSPTRKNVMDKELPPEWAVYPVVVNVLKRCVLLKYFTNQAVEAKYLQHKERMCILQTFAHLGQEGKEMIHRVMSQCLNYNSQTTERYIQRVLPKPISCPRLRENFPELTTSLGCDCIFRLPPKSYPSPVLHALDFKPKEMTVPIVQEKKDFVSDNQRLKVEALVKRLSELRKQRRGIDRAILNVETELGSIFSEKGIKELELSVGTLARRQDDTGDHWVISI